MLTSIGSSGKESTMPDSSLYIWNGMRENATGTKFSFLAIRLILTRHISTLTCSVRRDAHLWSLGLISRVA